MTFDPAALATDARILVVDDVPEIVSLIGSHLSREGYQVSTANSGEDALKMAARNPPDLILLDVNMPGLGGIETCRWLKKFKTTDDIPIIFVTAKTDTKDLLAGFQAGAVDYITKPINQEEVCIRVKNQLLLRKLVLHLQELNNQKNRFLGTVAHDLRNPLAGIKGYVEYIIEDDLAKSEEVQECMQLIYTSCNSMLKQVSNLLDITTIESGKLTLDVALASIEDLIHERVRLNRYSAEKKQISIQTSLEATPLIPIDQVRIGQVLDNFISNAVKFSAKGTQVFIALEHDVTYVRVSIKDEGPGIAPDEQSALFGEYSKLSAKPTGGEKSTGLGLAIVKKIIDTHNGKIEMESKIGIGTTFRILLPKDRRIEKQQ